MNAFLYHTRLSNIPLQTHVWEENERTFWHRHWNIQINKFPSELMISIWTYISRETAGVPWCGNTRMEGDKDFYHFWKYSWKYLFQMVANGHSEPWYQVRLPQPTRGLHEDDLLQTMDRESYRRTILNFWNCDNYFGW